MGDGRLAVCTRYTNDIEQRGRMAPQSGSKRPNRGADILDFDLCHSQTWERTLDEQSDRTARDRFLREPMTVVPFAGNTTKERPRTHGTGVMGDVSNYDVDITAAAGMGRSFDDELTQSDGGINHAASQSSGQ